MLPNIPYHAAAILIWLPPEQSADAQKFDLGSATPLDMADVVKLIDEYQASQKMKAA